MFNNNKIWQSCYNGSVQYTIMKEKKSNLMGIMKLSLILHQAVDIRFDRRNLKSYIRFSIQFIAVFRFGTCIGRESCFKQIFCSERKKNIHGHWGKKRIFITDFAPKITSGIVLNSNCMLVSDNISKNESYIWFDLLSGFCRQGKKGVGIQEFIFIFISC